jgi:glycosyltransferase involved in cell wall biosynthesis
VPGFPDYTRFRSIALRRNEDGVEVYHPRLIVGPGYSLYNLEAITYYLGIRRLVARLREEFPFDIIHAHFGYPDGVVGAWLGKRYGVPIIITEHALWRPWMDQYPLVRRLAVAAARQAAFHIAVSQHGKETIAHFTGQSERLRVIPNGVDGAVFSRPTNDPGGGFNPHQVLYVGLIKRIKGIDLLLRAMKKLASERPATRLVLVGGSFYRETRLQEEQFGQLAADLGIADRVTFVGRQPPGVVAQYMRESAVMVLPSRRESFGAVLVEALACGTPVVATRCGGPEDIVNEKVGALVPREDVDSLAGAIKRILDRRREYDPLALRAYALEKFSWERVAQQTIHLYREAIERFQTAGPTRARH